MAWTPEAGARALVTRLGKAVAVEALVRLMESSLPDSDPDSYRSVLLDIGDGHAERLMADDSWERLVYWPRVWAARALAYVGDETARSALLAALDDVHWRVRMTSVQTIGRLGIQDATPHLLERLDDDHPRVRAASVLALERTGTEEAVERLLQLAPTDDDRSRVERAVAAIIRRATSPG